MKQKPSFQFYAQDFLGSIDVQLMSAEEVGVYLLLLINCFNNGGSLPNNAVALSRLCRGITPAQKVLDKFYVSENTLRNKRMDEELKKQAKFFKDQKAKAQKRWQKAEKKPMPRHSRGNAGSMPRQSPRGQSSSTSTSTSNIFNNSKESLNEKSPEEKTFGKEEINLVLEFLRKTFGLEDFKESKQWQRNFGKNLASLLQKIGKEEFRRRLELLAQDGFKRKNCNSLKFIYGEIKSTPVTNGLIKKRGGIISL